LDAQQLADRIAAFPSWNYRFEFDGGLSTPLADPARVNRQEQRRSYFFEALLSLTGGSLEGRRVLDLGCSAGFWSLQAVEAGADFVLGVDARADYLEQAELVFEAKGVERSRYRFDRADLFDYDPGEQFDVVLCLGLLNVVAKPVALFELMTRSGAQLIVIDTGLSSAPGKLFEVGRLAEPRNKVDYGMVLVPTRRALTVLAGQFGLQAVPLARNITDYTSMQDYRSGERLAFICSGTVPLDSLPVERAPHRNAWVAALQDLRERAGRRLSA
jgi:SAM-dependent methyltransferase